MNLFAIISLVFPKWITNLEERKALLFNHSNPYL
jgi:hypothetical protein